ncbi:MAG: hypothetical protein ACRCUY_13255 [Thermoguttaceae bacterium]
MFSTLFTVAQSPLAPPSFVQNGASNYAPSPVLVASTTVSPIYAPSPDLLSSPPIALASSPQVYYPPIYFQPVQISGPEGTRISVARGTQFIETAAESSTQRPIGLQLGYDYRIRITNIPHHPGQEVFPTVHIIGRTFPPAGLELEFPIPIFLTQEDIELALAGRYVTRVVYLENTSSALPIRGDADNPISGDVSGAADPVLVAAQYGKPVAIVRLGTRTPSSYGNDFGFYCGSPAWLLFGESKNEK